jgi:hypothetical protein
MSRIQKETEEEQADYHHHQHRKKKGRFVKWTRKELVYS